MLASQSIVAMNNPKPTTYTNLNFSKRGWCIGA